MGFETMRNLLLTISYDGKRYHGWQIQQNAVAVQEVFQNALQKVLGALPDIKGCSRTDSGVHAYEYCVSVKTDHAIPCERLVGALNHFLPEDMAVHACREVGRISTPGIPVLARSMFIKIGTIPFGTVFAGYALHYWYPLDVDQLNQAAQGYLGRHDFTSFCTVDSRERGDLTRCVTKSQVTQQGDMVLFTVAADGFLYNMVRIMVGTLLRVAQGKIEPEQNSGNPGGEKPQTGRANCAALGTVFE